MQDTRGNISAAPRVCRLEYELCSLEDINTRFAFYAILGIKRLPVKVATVLLNPPPAISFGKLEPV